MIVDRMHTEFKVGVDKTDSFNSANFTDAEIDLYLSNAQEEFIDGESLEQKESLDLEILRKYIPKGGKGRKMQIISRATGFSSSSFIFATSLVGFRIWKNRSSVINLSNALGCPSKSARTPSISK